MLIAYLQIIIKKNIALALLSHGPLANLSNFRRGQSKNNYHGYHNRTSDFKINNYEYI